MREARAAAASYSGESRESCARALEMALGLGPDLQRISALVIEK
jgi:hypothetical protein